MIKTPKINQLRRDSPHGFSPWSLASCYFEPHGGEHVAEQTYDSQEVKREEGARDPMPVKVTSPSEVLPPTRPYFLKFPLPPNTATCWGPSFQHSFWGTLQVQTVAHSTAVNLPRVNNSFLLLTLTFPRLSLDLTLLPYLFQTTSLFHVLFPICIMSLCQNFVWLQTWFMKSYPFLSSSVLSTLVGVMW